MHNYFYGWYFRCQSQDHTVAIIPAVHLSDKQSSCSIQIITEDKVWKKEFPAEVFQINRDRRFMKIEDSRFSQRGIRLNVEDEKISLKGELRFTHPARPNYDIMGPFCCLPSMECRHALYSMQHIVNGKLYLDSRELYFKDSKGYMEGDSGISFPERYVWTQHFFRHGSLMLAAAKIPWKGLCFTGTIGIVWWKGREYRFATYLGASVKKMEEDELWVRQGKYQFRVKLLEKKMQSLNAPVNGKMTRQVGENPSCRARYCMMYKEYVVFSFETDHAAFEYEA